jgi:ABC-2 type transport system ATP-binding protein
MLSLTVRPGQVVCLLGPNGSGKSTTARLIVGLHRPTAGVIRWNGSDIQPGLTAYQRIVGYVPEEPRLYPYLTAPEYLEFVGGLHDVDRRTLARRIGRYLDLFELEGETHTPLSSFSKGMRQKVLLAAALLHDPDLVVLDEPCSGLDVASVQVHRHMVSALTRRGKAIVYSSHEMDLVERVCDDVLILHDSRAVAYGSVSRLRELAHASSLEEVFSALAVNQDVERIGDALANVSAR